ITASFYHHALITVLLHVYFFQCAFIQNGLERGKVAENHGSGIRCKPVGEQHIRPCWYNGVRRTGNGHELTLVLLPIVCLHEFPEIFLTQNEALKQIVFDIVHHPFALWGEVSEVYRNQSALRYFINNGFLYVHNHKKIRITVASSGYKGTK